VVNAADLVGSTEFIIDQVRAAAPGASWAIGTEIHLVHRLVLEQPEQRIRSLQTNVCPCATMNRIDPAHLLWALENLAAGHVVNPVRVPEDMKRDARLALAHPEQNIHSLQKNVCPCATMNRIDPAHLLWAMENLAAGQVVNAVRVPDAVKRDARLALDRMLALKASQGADATAIARD